MAHQMKNLFVFHVFHCVEGAFGAASGGTPKMKNGAPRDELRNGCGCVWAVPYLNFPENVRRTARLQNKIGTKK